MKQLNIFKRGIALLCSALLLSLSVCTVTLQASTLDEIEGDYVAYTHVPLEKIADLILTKQGIVAKYEVLQDVCADWATLLVDGFTAVYSNIGGTDTVYDRTSFESEIDAQGITGYKKEIMLDTYDEYCIDGELDWLEGCCSVVECNEFLKKYLVDDGVSKGKTYILDEEVIGEVNKVFQTWWSDNGDYFIWRVPAFSEISTDYFASDNYTFVDNFFEAIAEPNKVYYLQTQNKGQYGVFTPQLVMGVVSNPEYYFYTDVSALPNSNACVYPYYDGLQKQVDVYGYYTDSGSFCLDLHLGVDAGISIVNLELASNGYDSVKLFNTHESGTVGQYSTFTYIYHGLVGRNAFNIRLFKDDSSADTFVFDDQNVYFTHDYDSDNNTGVTYTGDYFINTYNTYNYTTVQETINNTENIDNSVVEEIVDNSVTEITNNYTYVEPEATEAPADGIGDGSGSSDSSNPFDGLLEKLGEVLGNVVGVLDDLLALALGFIVDAFNVILSAFTALIDMVNTFKDDTAGLSGALTAFFPFIPEEIWKIMTGTITIICGLAIINYFRNK